MSNKKTKNVKNCFNPKSHKKPVHIENPDSYFDKKPSWTFSKFDKDHSKWSYLVCNNFHTSIIPKLIDFESRTWADIENDKKHNHWISCEDLIKEAQDRIIELKYDFDEVFSLHLDGKLRLFGIIDSGVFYIIWIDKKHEICPSHKKHT